MVTLRRTIPLAVDRFLVWTITSAMLKSVSVPCGMWLRGTHLSSSSLPFPTRNPNCLAISRRWKQPALWSALRRGRGETVYGAMSPIENGIATLPASKTHRVKLCFFTVQFKKLLPLHRALRAPCKGPGGAYPKPKIVLQLS